MDTSQKRDKEGQTEKNTQDKEGQTEKEDKPPDAGSERNRDYGAPPEFKGLDNLETYKRAVNRWVVRTGFKPHEQAGKVIDSLPMDLAKKINKLPEADLAGAGGVNRILSHLAVLNGERPGDDQKKANREAIYQIGIQRAEALTDYVLRRGRQFDEAAKHGTIFPGRTKAQMLEEGADLSWQSQQNLKSNMFGHEQDYFRLKKVLINLDCTSEKIIQGGKTSAPSFAETSGGSDRPETDYYPAATGQAESMGSGSSSSTTTTTTTAQTDEEPESETESVMPESEVDAILKSIDEKDLEEDDCFFVFTLVLVERS